MKAADIRSMNETELRKKLSELKKELVKANAQIASGVNPKNPGQVSQTKKAIARILTIINLQNKVTNKKEEKKKA